MSSLKYLKEKFLSLPTPKKIIVIVLVLALGGFASWVGYELGYKRLNLVDNALSPKGKLISGKPEEPVNFPNPITGVLFKKSEASWANRIALAVIIENHSTVRPQSGLSKADIVYEALVEGGITRFLAVYLQEETTLGPVRSNRPYFIDWVAEYDAAYAHIGGSPEGQARVKAYGIKDLDQFGLGAPTYERVGFRAAPHNVYTSTEKLRQAAASRGYKKDNDIQQWKFTSEEPPLEARPPAFALNINYLGNADYRVRWVYNPANNSYLRENPVGIPHIDALTNTQLEFKTVILQVVNKSFDPSGHGRLFMGTIGSGQAKIFMNGGVVDATWKKDNLRARTKFFNANGEEITFNRGKFWVEVVPPESVNTY